MTSDSPALGDWRPDHMRGRVHGMITGGGKCSCAWAWEWSDGLLISGPEPWQVSGPCPAAERNGRPCLPAPWLPARVFELTAAPSTPRGDTLCGPVLARMKHEAERQARAEAMRCEFCRRAPGPAPAWALGCGPRELPPGAEIWAPHFWTEHGRDRLNVGHLCPACKAIQDEAIRQRRSVVVTMTEPRAVALGDPVSAPRKTPNAASDRAPAG